MSAHIIRVIKTNIVWEAVSAYRDDAVHQNFRKLSNNETDFK